MTRVSVEKGNDYEIWYDKPDPIPDDTMYDFVHYIGPVGKTNVYRRWQLNRYLNENFKVKTLKVGEQYDLRYPPKHGIIISAPQYSEFLKDIDTDFFYDRTDNWSANEKYAGMEDWILERAKVITVSARYLHDITPNSVRIDSGANPWNGYDVEREYIAVYVGKEDGKVDEDLCRKWKLEHPEFRFLSIGRVIPAFDECLPFMEWEEMMKFISKCKVGLIPLMVNEYTKGQFNLKYWDYKQAGLDVWTTIDYNYQDTEMRYWPEVCKDIIGAYINGSNGD